MNLKDLAVAHPYYCSNENNFKDADVRWDTMKAFLDNYEDADIDCNLVFRWDVYPPNKEVQDVPRYWAEIFIMHQRKGIFSPHTINLVTEDDVDRLVAYLEKHLARLNEMWLPLVVAGEVKVK